MRAFIRRVTVPAAAACLAAAAAPARAQPTGAAALSGRWTGTYACAQGTTALELDLRGNAHGIVQGTFRFYATPENPGVPSGAYTPETGERAGTITDWEIELDCAARRVRIWHTVQYAPDGRIDLFDASAPYVWDPIVEDSMYDVVSEYACPAAPAEEAA